MQQNIRILEIESSAWEVPYAAPALHSSMPSYSSAMLHPCYYHVLVDPNPSTRIEG